MIYIVFVGVVVRLQKMVNDGARAWRLYEIASILYAVHIPKTLKRTKLLIGNMEYFPARDRSHVCSSGCRWRRDRLQCTKTEEDWAAVASGSMMVGRSK